MRRDVKVDRDLHLGVAHHLAELFLTEHGLTVLRALGRAGLAARDVAPGVAVRRHAPRLAVAAADDIVAGRGALQVGEAADELGRDWHVAPGGRALELVRDDRLIVHPAQRAAHGDIRRSAVVDAILSIHLLHILIFLPLKNPYFIRCTQVYKILPTYIHLYTYLNLSPH